METLKIAVPDDTARRLRLEAERRNISLEEVAAKLLDGQLFPEEFFTSDEEADFYANAVHQYRNNERQRGS